MKSSQKKLRYGAGLSSILIAVFLNTGALLLSHQAVAAKDSFEEAVESVISEGKLLIDARVRWEHADAMGLEESDAYTLRTRLGYETAVYKGFQALVEMEDIRAVDYDEYNAAGLNGQGGKTPIADPKETELNRAWLSYTYEKTTAKLGRERIILDDSAFIGNVGWRQNEQTYDAVTLTNNSVENLKLHFSYIDRVHRIFGDDHAAGNFDTDMYLFNVNYSGFSLFNVTAFAYLQEVETTAQAGWSNDTYGLRGTGSVALDDDEKWKISYSGSWATQSDNSGTPSAAGGFNLDYWALEAKLHCDTYYIGAGFEILEGDGSRGFNTPFATVHKFNGWADAFIGGRLSGAGLPMGLEDYYVLLGGKAPIGKGLSFALIYHWFDPETGGGGDFGDELDFVASYPINKYLKALVKFAKYDGGDNTGSPADIDRTWVELNFKY